MNPTLNIYDASQTRDLSKLAPAKGSTMSADIKTFRTEAQAFAKEHLPECASELVEWQDTAILRDGRVRELAAKCDKFIANHDALRVAESFINRAAVEQAARATPSPAKNAVLSAKHEAVMRLAAKAIHNRGHEGDARLADSLLGVLAHLNSAAPTVEASQ